MANNADPDQTALKSSLIWVCIVCLGMSVPIFGIMYDSPKSTIKQMGKLKGNLVSPEIYCTCSRDIFVMFSLFFFTETGI